MRISDWSSDVCSSDLNLFRHFNLDESERGRCMISLCCGSKARARVWFRSRRSPGRPLCNRGPSRPLRSTDDLRVRERSGRWPVLSAVSPDTRTEHRSEEHTSELQSLMRNSYAVFCLKKKTNTTKK